jgi:hypothetical protein
MSGQKLAGVAFPVPERENRDSEGKTKYAELVDNKEGTVAYV